ncbi:flagellar type III secretion system pore protein FliP [Campylobacter mucosalis]|uniref:Flagellar biosynthetic protein FliP n=1 Tax=Campylobacter mucosalis CCUG 21559 TaxID=1032067 RepID=A0A6G5QHG3_9BACT|nr:flagellar type III secretion system pore protein FliP [Campylobacter mucosalis]QCD45017.1 flagellar export apparatus, flagellar biosynthetic protein FliP [Campylobacter mucosalis CCUG 21559]QKF62906.1 flagellar export apparatus, transmembrane gate complex, FliP component [Campylobacter mucosalis]
MRVFLLLASVFCIAFSADAPLPTINLSLNAPENPTQLVTSLNVLIVLTILTLAPGLMFMMTSFLRLIIVFSFLRQAMGTQQMPPSTVLLSIAMVLTFFIMEPTAKQAYNDGIKPYLAEQIGYEQAFDSSIKPFKDFMLRNTREKDLALFFRIRNLENPANVDEVPLTIVMSAFMISELKTAFEIAFLLYLPFLVIDMVVSSVLMAMGMMMLPPVTISLPFKLLIFVLVDGWNLLIGNLVKSFS